MNEKKITSLESELEELRKEDYSLLDKQHGFMIDGILGGFKASIHKMHYTLFKQLMLGILSGVIFGFGYTGCVIAINALPYGSGFANIMLGIFFPGCIILITYLGGGLYTSHVLATIPMLKKTIKVSDYFKGIIGILIGNWIGTLCFVVLFMMAGGIDMKVGGKSILVEAYNLGLHKLYNVGDQMLEGTSITAKAVFIAILAAFASGILCNFMVSSTLPLTNSSKHPVVAFFVIIFPIVFFAMSGYQHAPANSYFLWVLTGVQMFKDTIFLKDGVINTTLLGSTTEAQHVVKEIYECLSWANIMIFFAINLIPSLLGNWVSGAIFLPGILHLINKKYTDVFFKQARMDLIEAELKKVGSKNVTKITKTKARK